MSATPSTPQMLAHCPLCHAAYDDASVQLLGEQTTTLSGATKSRTFHLTCKSCQHAVLAVILESHHGVSSVGLVTDLEAQDAVRVHDAEPISADDVLRAHQALDLKSQELCKALL